MEEIIGGAVKHAQGALGQRPLSVQIDPGVSLVACDAVLIERVLANLLENAGKYTPAASPVDILVRPVEGELQVSVRDHGPGVAQGQEEIIFEKFTRGRTESATPGVGLGLAICRAIVGAHRGRIWVEPTHPHGASFTFSLPLGVPPAIDLTDDVNNDLPGTDDMRVP
jgi:two-component system sensor histidine kinase KdpD